MTELIFRARLNWPLTGNDFVNYSSKVFPQESNIFLTDFFLSFFQASLDDDDDDSPIIRGFADDEPLVVS